MAPGMPGPRLLGEARGVGPVVRAGPRASLRGCVQGARGGSLQGFAFALILFQRPRGYGVCFAVRCLAPLWLGLIVICAAQPGRREPWGFRKGALGLSAGGGWLRGAGPLLRTERLLGGCSLRGAVSSPRESPRPSALLCAAGGRSVSPARTSAAAPPVLRGAAWGPPGRSSGNAAFHLPSVPEVRGQDCGCAGRHTRRAHRSPVASAQLPSGELGPSSRARCMGWTACWRVLGRGPVETARVWPALRVAASAACRGPA